MELFTGLNAASTLDIVAEPIERVLRNLSMHKDEVREAVNVDTKYGAHYMVGRMMSSLFHATFVATTAYLTLELSSELRRRLHGLHRTLRGRREQQGAVAIGRSKGTVCNFSE